MIKGLRFIHVNTRSIYRKISLIENLYSDADFICCSETWLDNRIPDNMVGINNMKILRCDRVQGITDYNVHIIGGGVCIYMSKKWFEFTTLVNDGTCITKDYEVLSIEVNKPTFRKLFIACLYRPPKGDIENCLIFLKNLVYQYQQQNFEIWILGDFNIDVLKRDDLKTVRLLSVCKKLGLKQLIKGITRPNQKGGTCIDLIMTDSVFVSDSGVLDDFVSDHYSIYCIRKKAREKKDIISKVVRDYARYDKANFEHLLLDQDWNVFDNTDDPDVQWEIILAYVENILAIMCPFKRVNARREVTPWLTPAIYALIREKKALVKLYKTTKDPATLTLLRIKRNQVNNMIEKSKTEYITNSLNSTVDKPKKFWKLIKKLIDKDDSVDITSYVFRHYDTGDPVHKNMIPNYLNDY